MFTSNPKLTFNSAKTITRTTKLFINDENFNPSSSSAAAAVATSSLISTTMKTTAITYIDETTNDSFSSMDTTTTDEFSSSTEEVLYDSGISSDSSFSSCSENLYVTTGPINFNGICAKKSPDLPSEFFEDLDEDEQSANDSLNSSWEFDSLRAESSGRRSPLSDLTSSHQNRQRDTVPESPISRKSSRSDLKYCRKRSFRASIATQEIPAKKTRPQLHRAFSTSELEISTSSFSTSNYDSSPEVSTSKYSLKVVNRTSSKDFAFRRIDSTYLAGLIEEMGETFYEKYILIDCRYPFEYNGGHIKGAINLYDPDLLRSTFYPSTIEMDHHNIRSKKPIFYCEFSSVRGPNMANALRELDRQLNHHRYPYIDYNEIYVLSEGYKHFYHNTVRTYCIPQSYIPMKSKDHLKELQQYPFHQKSSVPMGFSIRSKSTMSLVQSQSLNRSPCFCSFGNCKCSKPLPPPTLRTEFSQMNIESPTKFSPLPFNLDSPFLSYNS